MIKRLIKIVINSFRTKHTYSVVFLSQKEQFRQAQLIIRIFYVAIFFFEANKFKAWSYWLSQTNFDPLWPVYWLQYVDVKSGILFILYLGLISSLLAITFPNWRITRMLVFFSLLEFIAFQNSFGKINHSSHLNILISFILIFLPSGWHSLKKVNHYTRTATLIVFSSCQSFIMLTYTMAGIGKVLGTVQQAAQGKIHNLAPQALAIHIASAFAASNESPTVLGQWLIDNYYIGWPLMVGAIYLQFFALWVVFRPSLHQVWGYFLILFHVASNFIMKIFFIQSCLWLTLFFISSPFRPINFNWQQILKDLPIFGYFFHKIIFPFVTKIS